MSAREEILQGRTSLGIELGSTRIKACLVGEDPNEVLATGGFDWENRLVGGLWSYPLEDVWSGVQAAVGALLEKIEAQYSVRPTTFGAIGVSAMMHGYLAFDSRGELLVPFRTWRNTNTGAATAELTELFGVNIPHRWSIAHLHQAVLDGEAHVAELGFMTTLAGYVHWRLTGRKVIGVGDASGMFPIAAGTFDEGMVAAYDARLAGSVLAAPLREILPEVLLAGQDAGTLTAEGAALLDPSGSLQPGIPLCAPEGDAGTGMVATNSVAPRTGNVSVGTSIFAMVVLERPFTAVHHEIDLVTTPAGDAVAMVHCNNGASEVAEWVSMFAQFARLLGNETPTGALYDTLFEEALHGDPDAGGFFAYNHLAGEPIAGTAEGRPLFVRTPESRFTLANVMRSHLYGMYATLALGMRVLAGEGVALDQMFAHGGVFRTPIVAQRFLAAALDAPVAVGHSASEGGAWGIAVLASYLAHAPRMPLGQYLNERIFANETLDVLAPEPEDVHGFAAHLARYEDGLALQRAAVAALPSTTTPQE